MTDDRPPMLSANERSADAAVDPQFLDRWSPRAFSPDPVDDEVILSLLEAARWAPSAGNDQPWFYVYARSDEDRSRFLEALDESNQQWARNAPLLMFLITRLTNARTGRPSRTARFDSGASWMSLALEARKLGLFAHAMAGFDAKKARDVLGVPEEGYEVMIAIAVGRYGDPDTLSEFNRGREKPNTRRHVSEFAFESRLPEKHG